MSLPFTLTCAHQNCAHLVWRGSNNSYCLQCKRCGRSPKMTMRNGKAYIAIPHALLIEDGIDLAHLPDYDDDLQPRWDYAVNRFIDLRIQADRMRPRSAFMTEEEYRLYRQSRHWRRLLKKKLRASNFTCICGAHTNIVHHTTYETLWHEDLDDLVALCDPCHKGVHRIPDRSQPIQKIVSDEIPF